MQVVAGQIEQRYVRVVIGMFCFLPAIDLLKLLIMVNFPSKAVVILKQQMEHAGIAGMIDN